MYVYASVYGDINTYDVSGLMANTQYDFRVKAIDSDGNASLNDLELITMTAGQSSFSLDMIPNNTLKIGDDFFDMNSDPMNDTSAAIPIASLLKNGPNKNKVFFKFGGEWYAPFELTEQQFLNPSFALTNEQVLGITGYNKWYKSDGDIIDLSNY